VNPRRAFLLALVGFVLLGAAWALALPVNGTYDESRHIIRGYAVVDGQWLPGGPQRLSFDVPGSLLPADPDCTWKPEPPKPASCQGPSGDSAKRATETYTARYSPVYYLPVGIPLKLWPDRTGVLVARLVSVLLNALLLAAAVMFALRISVLTAAGVMLVATPTVVNLAGSINPNGLEISAGVLLFAAGLSYLRHRTGLLAAGVAGFLLITLRHLGPLLFAIDVLALAVLAGRTVVASELRRGETWLRFGVPVGVGAAVAGAWALAARSPVGAGPGAPSDDSVPAGLVDHRLAFYVNQIVGQFGYGETTISPAAILLWYLLIGVVLWRVVVRGPGPERLVTMGLVVVGFALLIALEFIFVPGHGWFSHGRYALPVLVGAVLVGASAGPRIPWLPTVLVAATLPVHLYALARVMTRFQVGIAQSFAPFGGSWLPPVPPFVPLMIVPVGVALLTAIVWSQGMRSTSDKKGISVRLSTRKVFTH
jgi:hypothetical protein